MIESGIVTVYGRNNFGQLGLGFNNSFLSAPSVLNTTFVGSLIFKVSAGARHSILLSGIPVVQNFSFSGKADFCK